MDVEKLGMEKSLFERTHLDAPRQVTSVTSYKKCAWGALAKLEGDAMSAQQRYQVFVDGLAIGMGVAQRAQLIRL